jgi:hypothetical protein
LVSYTLCPLSFTTGIKTLKQENFGLKPHSHYFHDRSFIFISLSLSTSLPNSHFLSLHFQNPNPSDSPSKWVPKDPASLVILQHTFTSIFISYYLPIFYNCFCYHLNFLIVFQFLWIYNLQFIASVSLCWNWSRICLNFVVMQIGFIWSSDCMKFWLS